MAGQGYYSNTMGDTVTQLFTASGDAPKWQPVYDAARAAEPGELLSYELLARLIGVDVRTTNRYPIDAAKRHLERDSHRTLVAVVNEGYRVSEAREHAGLARWHQRKSRRQITKALSKASSADRTKLAIDQLHQLDALELHLMRQAEFLRRTAARVDAVEIVQSTQVARSIEQDERIAALEQRLERFRERE
jgi:hypothetical protein